MKKYFCIFAALTMLMSCTKSLSEANSQASGEMTQTVTVKVAPFVGLDTKSTISTGGVFAWTSGDKFGVYPLKSTIGAEQTSQQVMFQIQESAVGTNSGLFTGTGWGLVTGGDYKYFAYYPYDSKAEYDNVNVTYPCGYVINENSSTAHITEDYLVAPVVTPTTASDATFTFYHMGSLVNFKLNIPEADREATFNYMEIRCAEPVFATEGYYDPTGLEVSGTPAEVTKYPEFNATSTTDKISVTLNNCAPDQDGNLNLYIMLPPTALKDKTLNVILFGNNGKGYSASKDMGGNILSGRTYTSAFTMLDDEYAAIDLSKNGTANCYIVNEANKRYKFDCTVKGNGIDPVADDDEGAEITGFASAQITWETVNTGVEPVSAIITDVKLDKEAGCVLFNTPSEFVEGNALISVKDGSGTILWSWHVWATQADLEGKAQTYPDDAGVVMDRNLGALSATAGNQLSKGFFYQWGRPFPITGAYNWGTTRVKTTHPDVWDVAETSSTVGSLLYSRSHPTHFIYATSSNHSWYWGGNNTLWGNTKTMYDPCPVGWKVAGSKVFKPLFSSVTFNADQHAYLVADSEVHYPACSYFGSGGGISTTISTLDAYGMYHLSTQTSSSNYSFAHFDRTNCRYGSYWGYIGVSVRACKE